MTGNAPPQGAVASGSDRAPYASSSDGDNEDEDEEEWYGGDEGYHLDDRLEWLARTRAAAAAEQEAGASEEDHVLQVYKGECWRVREEVVT